MYVAAFDTRLKVIVSSCGWTLGWYYNKYNEAMREKFGSRLWGSAQERYTPLALTKYDLELKRMPFDFDELIAVLAPRPFFQIPRFMMQILMLKGLERELPMRLASTIF